MSLYEHVFLARQDVSNAQVEALTDKFKGIIEERGGSIGKVESWGLKGLAFRIKKNRKAHYTLMNIDADPDAVAEMERQMRLDDDIIRFMTIRVDEHEEGASAMMQSRAGRDDRRGGRDDRRGGRDDGPRRPRRDDDAPREAQAEAAPAGDDGAAGGDAEKKEDA